MCFFFWKKFPKLPYSKFCSVCKFKGSCGQINSLLEGVIDKITKIPRVVPHRLHFEGAKEVIKRFGETDKKGRVV